VAYERIMAQCRLEHGWLVNARATNTNTRSPPSPKPQTKVDSLSAFFLASMVSVGNVVDAAHSHDAYFGLWRRYGYLPELFDVRTQRIERHGYPLRPEFLESTLALYRATSDPYYLRVGAHLMRDLNSTARVPCGFAHVDRLHKLDDRMESYFLSETLKYFFLLFDHENPVLRSNFVFTTEAHPLPVLPLFQASGASFADLCAHRESAYPKPAPLCFDLERDSAEEAALLRFEGPFSRPHHPPVSESHSLYEAAAKNSSAAYRWAMCAAKNVASVPRRSANSLPQLDRSPSANAPHLARRPSTPCGYFARHSCSVENPSLEVVERVLDLHQGASAHTGDYYEEKTQERKGQEGGAQLTLFFDVPRTCGSFTHTEKCVQACVYVCACVHVCICVCVHVKMNVCSGVCVLCRSEEARALCSVAE
jgi:Glycosyl hydrolase family 47